jgi:hypothetical protein
MLCHPVPTKYGKKSYKISGEPSNVLTADTDTHFYFGVLHPLARILSRLLQEPSLATTLQGVCCIFFIFFVLLGLTYCICLANTAYI